MASINELLERLRSELDTLAVAIRAKTGKTESLDLAEMATEQDAVFDAGKAAGTDAFWDVVQNNGSREIYTYAFYCWNAEYIRPKYKVVAANANDASNTFARNAKLKKVESAYFDFSQKPTSTSSAGGHYYTFFSCTALEEIEDIGLMPQYSYSNTFGSCPVLHTIARIGVDDTL